MKETLYEILGTVIDAPLAAIKEAYRIRAKETHPDGNDGNDAQFKRVAAAYAVLKNKAQRREYDETGREDFDAARYIEKHVEMVLNLFSQAVDAQSQVNALDEESNPFLIVRNELEHKINEGQAALTEGGKRCARLKELQRKVTKRRKKLHPFRKIIDGSLEQVERRMVDITADLKVCRAALKFINATKWEDLFVIARDVEQTQRMTGRGYVLTETTATITGGTY